MVPENRVGKGYGRVGKKEAMGWITDDEIGTIGRDFSHSREQAFMDPFEYFHIAMQTIAQNKARSLLTMLGVIIGVMAVVVLVALGEAAQRYVELEFAGMGSNLLNITPGKQETTGAAPMVSKSFRKLTNENAREIRRRARGVALVAPLVIGAGAVRFGDRLRDSMVFGVTEECSPVRNIYPQFGRFITHQDDEKNSAVCLLGLQVKKDLFGDTNPLNEQVTINRRKFQIVGVMEEIGTTLGINMDDMVIIPLSGAQQMFHRGQDELYQITVSATNAAEVSEAAESIREVLIAAHDHTEDFTILDQASILQTFNDIFGVLKAMLAGLASISLLVGGIGIMNIMLVSVRERTREVGIRKAVGATRSDIGFQFLVESITLSGVGGILGIALGYVGTMLLMLAYPLFPVSISMWSVAMAFFFSLAVGVFFGVYPALKAVGVDPVEALRYE